MKSGEAIVDRSAMDQTGLVLESWLDGLEVPALDRAVELVLVAGATTANALAHFRLRRSPPVGGVVMYSEFWMEGPRPTEFKRGFLA